MIQVFQEISFLCDDMFWTNMFEDLACNKPPFGVSVVEKKSSITIKSSLKEKEFIYTFSINDPLEKIKYDVHKLFNTKLNISSAKDKNILKQCFEDHESDLKNENKEWKNIRKTLRSLHYEAYVVRMKNEYNLSLKQARYLLALITTLINFKMLQRTSITFENDQIENIEGIVFNKKPNGEYKIERTKYEWPESVFRTENQKIVQKRLEDLWYKFLMEKQ